MEIFWWFYAVVALLGGVLKNYSEKPFRLWSWQRKLYFTCWGLGMVISIVNGFRILIADPSFNFWAQLALGVQLILIAFVPCGMDIFNKPWPVRRMRDLVFIGLGALHIHVAFLITH
jgi:hypothetical protein